MNAGALHDAAWAVIQHDPALTRARRVLSIHEFRLVIERIATAMRQQAMQLSDEFPKGCLEVGMSEDGREVVVNHPDLKIIFSPAQARDFAALLFKHAGECRP